MRLIPTHRNSHAAAAALTFIAGALTFIAAPLYAETCTTQSQMKAADRDLIANTARTLATQVEYGDGLSLRQQMVPEFARDFSAMNSLIASTSSKIQGSTLTVDQVYLLDATNLKTLGDGTNPDAQFFCSLNRSIAEASFLIPALPPGRYAFATIRAIGPKAQWTLSFLLRQDASSNATQPHWLLAGFYPKTLIAAGHDGLWYWTQARDFIKAKQIWTAYLYYQEAESLLRPAGFVSSTHLDKLRDEATSSAPPSLSAGISRETPLVVKGLAGSEYRFTALTPDDSLAADKVDVLVHLAPEPEPDPSAPTTKQSKSASTAIPPSPRDRNIAAAAALLAAYPELRNSFHGVWVFADVTGTNPFVTETPMSDIH